VRVKILEIDSERRRLSLSIKRVEGQELPVRPIAPEQGAGDLDHVPELGLSEDVFADSGEAPVGEEPPPAQDAPASEPELPPPAPEDGSA
jgi:small subunit ribosomal protein S1